MVHERNRALLPIAESCSGKSLRRTFRILLVNRKLRVIRRRIDVIIAILIVQAEKIAELPTSVSQSPHSFPSPRFRRGRKNIWMLPIITHLRPTGEHHGQPFKTVWPKMGYDRQHPDVLP